MNINNQPSLPHQAATFGKAIINWTASGFHATPPNILAAREATCRACPEWDAAAMGGTGRCKKCGCSTWAKLRMATEACPLGKWPAAPSAELVASLPGLPAAQMPPLPKPASQQPSQIPSQPVSPPVPPSITDMAKGFFSSAAKFVAAGMPRTPLEQLQVRLDTCRACQYWKPEDFGGTGSCQQCGCSTQVKLRMANMECPMGYWQAVPPHAEA